jgi:phenylacetate-CoA ligase
MTPKDIFDMVIMRNKKRNSGEVVGDAMKKHYKVYMHHKPTAIRGYASSLVILARYIEENNLPKHPLKLILTTGEMLMPEYRYTLEHVFECPVYDEYGAGDGGVNAHECTLKNGLHISEERCVIEITDKDGNVKPDGEIGLVTTTDLGNFVFPFLRYQVGDLAYIKPDKCACGRTSRVLGQVVGRAGKLLYNKQGIAISPTILDNMMYINNDYHTPEHCVIYNKIDKFQIRQDKLGDITIYIKLKDSNENKQQFEYCIDNFADHFVGSKVELKFVDEIPLLPSGKIDYCVSEYEPTIQ